MVDSGRSKEDKTLCTLPLQTLPRTLLGLTSTYYASQLLYPHESRARPCE